METKFSFHAYERVLGRISMTHRELADLLGADLVIVIGQEQNNNRVHKLFHSAKDNVCFVAIQDIKTGTVITVLPIDYHENICWSVSIDAQQQAKKIITKDECITSNIEVINSNATVFRISGNLVDDYGKYIKTLNLGSWPCTPYEHSVDSLIEDDKFKDFLVEKINEKLGTLCNTPILIQTIAIRIGSRGEPVSFSLSDLIESNA